MPASDDTDTLADLGELGLIARAASLPPLRADVRIGIGDDCAVLREPDGSALLVTTDALMEGIHFRRDWSSAESIGHKALAVNLSDVAAMGGEPVAAFLAFSAPADLPVSWVDGFLAGLRALAARHGVDLLGGDTTGSRGPVALCLTVLGRAPMANVRLRSGARPGDLLVVSGRLGEAAKAVHVLTGGGACPDALRRRLEWPEPRVATGRILGASSACTALMDLSDGLGSDLQKLTAASGVGARVIVDRVPVSDALVAACGGDHAAATNWALRGGDDYELLGTWARDVALPVLPDVELSVIGEVEEGQGVRWVDERGQAVDGPSAGFDHFGAGA